ncbi:hypothetical protein GCWU000322_00746 [Eubacterium saphenum ATCC 49989]|nr:hypothetical protein GCWU000322_00746 [Eubacterium saphenum ATCC 49989]
MKVWKLVSGILSIIWSGWVMLGAGVTGFLSDMEGSKDDGTAVVVVGFFVSILMVAGGIVSIAVKNKIDERSNGALAVIFGIAALVGVTGGSESVALDFGIVWCLACAVNAVVCIFQNRKNKSKDTDKEDSSKS